LMISERTKREVTWLYVGVAE
jgi:hypothetical protein